MLDTQNHRQESSARLLPDEPFRIIAALGSPDGVERQAGREKLMSMGKAAIPALIHCLGDSRKQVRWEAAKTLIKVPDPAAAGALVDALEDDDGDVRWLSAIALVAIGRDALRPLFVALIEDPQSDLLRQGGHHVCHELARTGAYPHVQPVLDAMGSSEPRVAVPVAAYKALHAL